MEFERYTAGPDGWSDWVQPAMSGYLLKCCNCDLVHEVEFVALRVVKRRADGLVECEPLPPDAFQVGFRIRAHEGESE
jgi:hypothetical protein